jgi:hypothetical protein
MKTNTPIIGRSSIGDWLGHPMGGPLLRELLAQAGQDANVLTPARNLPLEPEYDCTKPHLPTERLQSRRW